jgi:hypothetical protein
LIYFAPWVKLPRMSGKLTTAQAAERLKVAQPTVKLWCRQGKFPNAQLEETPRGPVWQIPESDLKNFEPPKMGRPRNTPSTAPDDKKAKKKAVSRWENEGGATPEGKKKGGKK